MQALFGVIMGTPIIHYGEGSGSRAGIIFRDNRVRLKIQGRIVDRGGVDC